MALVIETGTGSATAEAYADAAAYAAWYLLQYSSAVTASTALQEAAIRRAVDYLGGLRWVGKKSYGRVQALTWPRVAVVDLEGWYVASGIIPPEVIEAQHLLTVAEIANPGCLAPSLSLAAKKTLTTLDVLGWTPDMKPLGTGAYRTQVTAAMDRLRGFVISGGMAVRA